MYNIILKTWYSETGDQEEILDNLEFSSIIEAVDHLSNRIEYIEEWFPIVGIIINCK